MKRTPKRLKSVSKRRQNAKKSRQKRVRKTEGSRGVSFALQNNLGRLVAKFDSAGKVKAYENIAAKLSQLAPLNHDHVWSWRYVASVHSGTIAPSKKFLRAFDLYFQEIKPGHRQWHYFACRNDVLCFRASTARAEIIRANLKPMGYKMVTFSRYMQIKKRGK